MAMYVRHVRPGEFGEMLKFPHFQFLISDFMDFSIGSVILLFPEQDTSMRWPGRPYQVLSLLSLCGRK